MKKKQVRERIRYAIDPQGQIIHANQVHIRMICSCVCCLCNQTLIFGESPTGLTRFKHVSETDCTGILPKSRIAALLSEPGSKASPIEMVVEWRRHGWKVTLVELSRDGNGFMAGCFARRSGRRIRFTGEYLKTAEEAMASIKKMFEGYC